MLDDAAIAFTEDSHGRSVSRGAGVAQRIRRTPLRRRAIICGMTGSSPAQASTETGVLWTGAPAKHDYPAAAAYLSLLADPARVKRLVKGLRKAPLTHQKAKDILRAAGLPLLARDNAHVAADLAKIAAGTALSPVLLVRGELISGRPLQIADGYHRVCASYLTDENTDIPCRIVAADIRD